MKGLMIVAVVTLVCALQSCASQREADRNGTLDVSGSYTAIEAEGNVVVEYTVGSTPSAVVTAAESRCLKNVRAEVKDGTLRIYTVPDEDKGCGIHVKLVTRQVTELRSGGNTIINVLSHMDGIEDISVAGNSIISCKKGLTAKAITMQGSGNALVYLEGKTDVNRLTVMCSGNYGTNVQKLAATELKVSASGNAHIKCPDVQLGKLNVALSGNAGMTVAGYAAQVSYSTSGNAGVRAGKLKAGRGSAGASGNSTINCSVDSLSSSTSGNANIHNKTM